MQSKIQKLNSIYKTTDINTMPEPSDNEFIPVPSEEPVNTTPKPPVENPNQLRIQIAQNLQKQNQQKKNLLKR